MGRLQRNGIFPYIRRGKYDPLVAVGKMCTQVVIKVGFYRHIQQPLTTTFFFIQGLDLIHVLNRKSKAQKEIDAKLAGIRAANWVEKYLPPCGESQPLPTDAGRVKKTDNVDQKYENVKTDTDGASSNVSSSYFISSSTDEIPRSLFLEEDALLDSDYDTNETNHQIIKDVINDVIELTVRKAAHNEAVEKLVQEMFLKAKAVMMQEVYQVQEVSDQRTGKKIDNLEGRVSHMNRENNAFREDILELEKEVGKVSAVSDDALSKAAENKAAIGRNNKILETLQLKASLYERNQEDFEAVKMDLASSKRKYQEDHNSLRQEVDSFRKKQKIQEAKFVDIEREVSLLKTQLNERKKEDASGQNVRKEVDQLKTQILQVEARLSVKEEQQQAPMHSPPGCPQYFSPPTPSSCKGSDKLRQEEQNEAMVIYLNRSSVKEIATIPGIGNKMAQLIYNQREMKGKFSSLMQIKNIPGIIPSVFNKFVNSNQLTLN